MRTTLFWVNPDLPALGSTSRTGTCDQAKPIKVLTVRSIFEFKAELIHLNVLVCSRDTQYGAAHDVALMSGSDRMNDDEIGAELNYSSSLKKTTGKYKGPRPRDIWTERVQSLVTHPPVYSDVRFGYDNPVLRQIYVPPREFLAELQKDITMQDRPLDRSNPIQMFVFATADRTPSTLQHWGKLEVLQV